MGAVYGPETNRSDQDIWAERLHLQFESLSVDWLNVTRVHLKKLEYHDLARITQSNHLLYSGLTTCQLHYLKHFTILIELINAYSLKQNLAVTQFVMNKKRYKS